jgi:hypothetical protein
MNKKNWQERRKKAIKQRASQLIHEGGIKWMCSHIFETKKRPAKNIKRKKEGGKKHADKEQEEFRYIRSRIALFFSSNPTTRRYVCFSIYAT